MKLMKNNVFLQNCFLTVRVVAALAVLPRQFGGEADGRVVNRPSDDHVVVESHAAAGEQVGKSQTFNKS
jgi:hypothetical protein